jgi:hypothetical protein
VDAVTYPHMTLGHLDFLSDEQMAAIRENQRGVVTPRQELNKALNQDFNQGALT